MCQACLLKIALTYTDLYDLLHFAPPFLKVSSVSSSRTCFILFDEFLDDIFLSWYTNSFWKRSGEKAPPRWHLSESETVPDSPSQRQRGCPWGLQFFIDWLDTRVSLSIYYSCIFIFPLSVHHMVCFPHMVCRTQRQSLELIQESAGPRTYNFFS